MPEGRLPPVPSKSSIVLHLGYTEDIPLSHRPLQSSLVAGSVAMAGSKSPDFVWGELAIHLGVLPWPATSRYGKLSMKG